MRTPSLHKKCTRGTTQVALLILKKLDHVRVRCTGAETRSWVSSHEGSSALHDEDKFSKNACRTEGAQCGREPLPSRTSSLSQNYCADLGRSRCLVTVGKWWLQHSVSRHRVHHLRYRSDQHPPLRGVDVGALLEVCEVVLEREEAGGSERFTAVLATNAQRTSVGVPWFLTRESSAQSSYNHRRHRKSDLARKVHKSSCVISLETFDSPSGFDIPQKVFSFQVLHRDFF